MTLPPSPDWQIPSCWPHAPGTALDGFCDQCRPNPGPWQWSETHLNGECIDLSDSKGEDVLCIHHGYEGDDWLAVSAVNQIRLTSVPDLLRIARWVAGQRDQKLDGEQPPPELVILAQKIMEKLKDASKW